MKKRITMSITGLAVAAAIAVCFMMRKKPIAYVNTYQVYDQFKLKKELEAKLKKTQLSRQVILDSLKSTIQFTAANKTLSEVEKITRVNELKENYFVKERQYTQDNEAQAQQYTDQVWEQLNQYVKEYGTAKKYAYILGANGQGSLMFADEENNVTKEVIDYVNEKFEGHK